MNPLLILKGLELLNTTLSNNPSTKKQEDIVKEILNQVEDNKPFWKRKTWWSMAVGVLIPVINKFTGLDLQTEEIAMMISPLLLFILSEQWRKK